MDVVFSTVIQVKCHFGNYLPTLNDVESEGGNLLEKTG